VLKIFGGVVDFSLEVLASCMRHMSLRRTLTRKRMAQKMTHPAAYKFLLVLSNPALLFLFFSLRAFGQFETIQRRLAWPLH
jgi:hypothetical protein